MCKLIEGLDRLPSEGEHVEIRMYESHTRKAVIDRADGLLTPEEVRENGAAVTQAILNELKTWQAFKCFRRRLKAEAPCIIDAKWVCKWKYVNVHRTLAARPSSSGTHKNCIQRALTNAWPAISTSDALVDSQCRKLTASDPAESHHSSKEFEYSDLAARVRTA